MNVGKFQKELQNTMLIGRKNKKWTQVEAAEQLGISRSYYSEIETGISLPSLSLVIKINSVFPFFLLINDADRVFI
ncbi:helix-turn-helix domain-containing protein [Carnobacterium mobile]|uniref:helix-turn-helix domain-containing protein n=1 Tax=Carnobacterium mobile TaxID=2750 RepID=UPI0005523ED1|nr:helix-turn-helix transcriptional regulator [Carnobacterium mobile]